MATGYLDYFSLNYYKICSYGKKIYLTCEIFQTHDTKAIFLRNNRNSSFSSLVQSLLSLEHSAILLTNIKR